MIVPTKSSAESKRCLRCKEVVSGQEHGCSACGYSLEGTKLYNPKHFVLLSLFFTGMVPIFLAASNWGRLGDLPRKRRWLWFGLAGYMVIFGAAMLLPDLGKLSNRFIGYLINLPVGMALLGMQRSTYLSALELGAKRASSFVGLLKGLPLVVLAFMIPLLSFTGYMMISENRALALLSEDRCAEAATEFEKLLAWDAEDEYVRFNLAICHECMGRWADAADGFRFYLQRHPDDPGAHELLGYVLMELGQDEEADRHFAAMERLLQEADP